jgi:hypothetical protein
MNKFLLFLALLCSAFLAKAQSTLFDENRVNNVYIIINANDLKTLYQDTQSDTYFKVDFVYSNGPQSDTVKQVGFRLRGNTSRAAEKKSFRVSFNEFTSGAKYQGVKKLNLNGSHNDPTMIREKLFYHCWSKFGLPERRASFVRLYINNQYYGVYTQFEELDKDWCERAYGNNGGNLYKCRYPADLQYLGNEQNKYKSIMHSATERAYDLKTNELADDYSDLITLCSALNQTVDDKFEENISKVLNVNDYLKAVALEVMSGHWDDYTYNKNNYYLYKNNKTGKFEFISYDADNTFGVDWIGQDWGKKDVKNWLPKSPEKRPLTTKLLAVNNFNQLYLKYLDSIATYVLHPDTIFPYITKIHGSIRPYVAADPYYPKDWGYNLQKFNDGLTKSIDGHTPYGIRPFISTRIQYMKQQNTATTELSDASFYIKISPNPSQDFINISSDYQGIVNVKVYNQNGQLLKIARLNLNLSPSMSLADLPKGNYQIVFMNDKKEFLKSEQILKM